MAPQSRSGTLQEQVEKFRSDVLLKEFRDRVKLVSYESYIAVLRSTGKDEAMRLADFLERHVNKLVSRQTTPGVKGKKD